jgi:diguanylate cyclase (GGDEF)-like protein
MPQLTEHVQGSEHPPASWPQPGFPARTPDVAPAANRDPSPEQLLAEQQSLLAVAQQVARGIAPAEVFRLVAREVAGILDAECGLVWRFAGDAATVVGSHGEHRSQVGVVFPLTGGGAVAQVARSGSPARVEYGALDSGDATAARVIDQGYVSGVAAPVAVEGRPWGAVLVATTTNRPFPPDAEQRLERFAELVSIALANAQAREDLARRATLDHLTGVANQGEFHRRLAQECSSARRHGAPLALAVFDVDHFKMVNDSHGHQVGDRILQLVAHAIAGEARAEDLLARAGGEEFALILPGAGRSTALAVAERARRAVASTEVAGMPPVTVSAGVATIDDAAAEDLFAAADRALYTAKRAGRDRVAAAGDGLDISAGNADGLDSASAAIHALARAVEARDPATFGHSKRVAGFAARMAAAAGWEGTRIAQLRDAALVHDVGKIGVPDEILLKEGRLASAEYDAVKAHADLGAQIVGAVLGAEATSWVRHHHERFDGAGYPDGLSGEAIPDGARIIAVADAFEAMTAGRPYARPRDRAACLDEIARLAGVQFDPGAVACLLEVERAAARGVVPRR